MVLQILYDHLHDQSKVQPGKRVAHIDHSQSGVKVVCQDGSQFEGDIVVGADGVSSKVRQEMWRIADDTEPGSIPARDKTAMTSTYRCLFGIATPTRGIPPGRA